MSSKATGCFFLDSMIVLPQPMSDRVESSEKFLKEASEKCYLSSSVVEECNEVLNNIFNWLTKDIRDNFKKFLNEKNIKELKRNDTLKFESFFEERRRELSGKQAYYLQIQGEIEHWIIEYIKSIQQFKSVDSVAFTNYLTAKITEIYEAIKSKIEAFDEITIKPQPPLRTFLLRHGITHNEDQDHLSSAIQYQYENNCWVVFVSYEGRSILNFRDYLLRNALFNLSKPDYAIDKLATLIAPGGLRPLELYGKIANRSDHQKRFVTAMKESIDVAL
jgi:hypothetical protein